MGNSGDSGCRPTGRRFDRTRGAHLDSHGCRFRQRAWSGQPSALSNKFAPRPGHSVKLRVRNATRQFVGVTLGEKNRIEAQNEPAGFP